MLQFLETGKALYVLMAICLMGVISRMAARSLYKRLTRETDNMTLTKNRYLRDLKQRTENTYRLNQGIKNVGVYLEKQLTTYRFGGISLNGWANLSAQLTILCFLAGGLAAFGAYWYRCDNYYIVLYAATGILSGLLTMVVDYGVNLGEKQQQLLCALRDYMENSLFNRLSRETVAVAVEKEDEPEEEAVVKPARRVSRARKPAVVAAEPVSPRKDIDYLKRSLEQIAASREKTRPEGDWVKDLKPEELKLVSDILQEYLA